MSEPTAENQLAAFIDKFTPEMAASIRSARRKLRALLPHAVEVVYDYRSSLVISYAPGERGYEGIFALACRTGGIDLYVQQGAGLPDPNGLLSGRGKLVRSLRLESPETLDRPEVRALMRTALERAKIPMDPGAAARLVIRTGSGKQSVRRAQPRAANGGGAARVMKSAKVAKSAKPAKRTKPRPAGSSRTVTKSRTGAKPGRRKRGG